MNELIRHTKFNFIIPLALISILFWLSYAVLREFFLVITWAVIITYVMWPLFKRLKKKLKNRATLSAAVMTAFISALISLTFFGLINSLQREVVSIYQELVTNFSPPSKELPASLRQIPWLSHYLQQYLDQLNIDEAGIKVQLLDWIKQGLGQLAKFLGGVGRNILTLGFILVTLFFCFRDGQQVAGQLKQGLSRFLGEFQNSYLKAAGDTAQAVVYGLVLAAIGQGIFAGIGYAVVGVKAPALLGAITALFAMVPMGATLIWLPVCIGLFTTGQYWQGVGLMLWGVFVVSMVDNIIRPLVISGAGRIPFLVVLFGVFGGLQAFGFVGLFLGPIILSVLLAVWQAWLKQQTSEH
jgi:P-type Ca2+ transporter type 2C